MANDYARAEKSEQAQSTGSADAKNQTNGAGPLPAISLPKGGGAIRGIGEKFAANPVTGTGYHVEITGYGSNGTGNTGQGSIDFRRRIAENYVGLLGSLDDHPCAADTVLEQLAASMKPAPASRAT